MIKARNMRYVLLSLLLSSISFSQSIPPDSVWTFAYDDGGDEFFYDALELEDGYLLCGRAGADALLLKIGRDGRVVWQQRFAFDQPRRFTKLPSVGRVWGEITNSTGTGQNIFKVHFDSLGRFVEEEVIGDEAAPLRVLAEATTTYSDDEEGYLLVYTSRVAGETENSIFRYECCGTVSNTQLTSGRGDLALAEDRHFDFAICGRTREQDSYSLDGLLVWRRYPEDPADLFRRAEYGGSEDDWFNDLTGQDGLTPYVLCGGSRSESNGSSDLWVMGVSDTGAVRWSRHFGGLSYEDGVEIVSSDDDGFIIAGNFSSEDIDFEQSDFWLLKVDENGDSVWSVLAGGEEADRCEGMIQTEHGFLLFGASQSFAVPGWDACAMLLAYVPDLAAAPSSLNFGPVQVGDSATRVLHLINTGSNTLTVTDIQGTDAYHANFNGPATIALGETLSVTTVFTPPSTGNHVDTLRIFSDAISGVKIVRCLGAGLVAHADDAGLLPRAFALHPPYPNPFNPGTSISFDLPRDSEMTMEIYDVSGRLVRTLFAGSLPAGSHRMVFEADALATGLYFAALRAGEYHGVQKLMLVK